MKKFIETIKNIWSIDELRKRILYTLGLLFVYRIGCYILLPGIVPAVINNTMNSSKSSGGLMGMINMFSGGAFNRASIFALGVMPYISASIFMQLAGIVVPQVAKMQREESGRRKFNQYVRYLTVIVTAFQASAYVVHLRGLDNGAAVGAAFQANPFFFWLSTVAVLTAGTMFVMWMGEKITDKGVGNGTSIIIMVGILARLPSAMVTEYEARMVNGTSGLILLLIELAAFLAVIVGLILLTQGTRRIPLNYARRIIGSTNASKDVMGNSRDFIPLKVNAVGVMPIIFAQALFFIPQIFMSNTGKSNAVLTAITDTRGYWYYIIYAVLVIAFTYFYTAITFNPTEIADNLKRNNSFIPGVKPGEPTANFIATIMDRITLPGALFLAIAGILPGAARILHVSDGFADFYGGTSMLIGVGVILDTLQQIEMHLLNRQYDGLMKTGRVAGRTPIGTPTI